jgi:hypothetical protein
MLAIVRQVEGKGVNAVDGLITVANTRGESARVVQGQRYYKSGGDANIRADSPTRFIYENDRTEESEVSASYFVRKYNKEGYRSLFPRDS